MIRWSKAMANLSPAAQAVYEAAWDAYWIKDVEHPADAEAIAAAALRAAADQVAPEDYDPPVGISYPEKQAFVDGKCVRNEDIRFAILSIANELEDLDG